MQMVQNFPLFAIIFMTSCSVICAVLKPKAAKYYCLFWLLVTLVLHGMPLGYVLKNGSYVYWMSRWPAPWGNEIRVGVLEALMAFAFTLVMLLSCLGGMKHIFEDVESTKTNLYFTMISFLMLSLLVLVYTNDIFTAYVFVEINTIASCALVMLRFRPGRTLAATVKYMVMSLLGSGLFLLGICILYNITGHLLMEPMGRELQRLYQEGQYLFPLTVAVALFGISLSIKSALFPFHTWLPDAHGSATATSSAVLSGLVLKGYIFLLMKIYARVIGLNILADDRITDVLFLFGVLAMILGSLRAMMQKDLKRMLAYSSIAQIGYIFLGIGLRTEEGFAAACVQILAHAVTKPMLFCCAAGFMDVSGGSRQMKDLVRAGWRDPLSGAAFVTGSLSMIGIPFFAGFITKVSLTGAVVSYGHTKLIFGLAAIAISTVLNALYYIPVIATIFSARKDLSFHEKEKAKYQPAYVIAMVLFMLCNFAVGTFAGPLLEAIRTGISQFGM